MMREFLDVGSAGTTSKLYLYDLHIFIMANILRRPIVVYGDRMIDGIGDSRIPG